MWDWKLIQIRAMKIIFVNLSYIQTLTLTRLCTIENRLAKLSSEYIDQMLNESDRLHYLLPEANNRR